MFSGYIVINPQLTYISYDLCQSMLLYSCLFVSIQAGHMVTVYERNDRVGGLLRYGIPTMKLSKEVRRHRVYLYLRLSQ